MWKYKHKPRMLRVLCNNCYEEQDDYVYCRKCLDGVKDAALREQQNAIAKGLEKWAEGGRFKPEIGAWIRSCAKYVRAFEPGKEDGEDG